MIAGRRDGAILTFCPISSAETFSGGASPWHGGDGPLHVLSLADVADRTPVAAAFISAAQELGFAMTPDIGGAMTTGVGWNQPNVKAHKRDDAAQAYLGSLGDVELDLLVNTDVLNLVIEGGRCTGVRLKQGIVQPEIEVLLCAGAIDSPRLLMLSGIGPADYLRSLGIPIAIDLPEVGRNLQDHVLVAGVAYRARREVPRSTQPRQRATCPQ
jgi:choline dehydrogenase-like flavoprotein